MDRRVFLRFGAGMVLAGNRLAVGAASLPPELPVGKIVTVLGPISPADMGETLPHEHILVDFIGADQVSRSRYNADEVFKTVLPYLQRVKNAECRTLVECTPDYLGRDAALLKRLSEASGMQLLTNTGYYGAAGDKYVPAHAYTESAEPLAARWIREWKEGIEDTGIRPGFIKIGVDNGPLSAIDRKLVQAAAIAHRGTGLTIAAHTGDSKAALEELSVLKEEGVHPGAWIWVHAQNEGSSTVHARVAEQGAWVEFDGINPSSIRQYVNFLSAMKNRGFLDHVLISQDAGWYHVGEPRGGSFTPYETLFTQFLPALKDAGFTDAELRRLIVDNPREAFTVRVRTLSGIKNH